MKLTLTVFAAMVFLAAMCVVAALQKNSRRGRKASGELRAKRPLTQREQSMYFRLVEALPQHLVLPQMPFSAILETRDWPTRSTFDRKVADYVVCSRAFEVIAVIELDDASHRGREAKDARRQNLLEKAGYRVIRYQNLPDADEVIRDFEAPTPIKQIKVPLTKPGALQPRRKEPTSD